MWWKFRKKTMHYSLHGAIHFRMGGVREKLKFEYSMVKHRTNNQRVMNSVIKHNMMITVFCITCHIILVSGSSLSDDVHQSPADIFSEKEATAKIACYHTNDNYNQILWYKQAENKQLQYLGYYFGQANLEPGVNMKIDGGANKNQNCTLTIEGVNSSSSAVYFCAARYGNNAEAYFGGGTKLTVLENEHNITPPKVTVLRPSAKECRDPKDNQRKKTLVCVATGFYPDHVTVSWKINDENVTSGVATDAAALPDGKFYKTTSRLRVSAEDWFKPDNKFTCIVNFFNGTQYQDYKNSVDGVKAEDGKVMTREKYLRISQNAKLSYGVFIVKSCIYGAFVAFLVWKLQGSAGKWSN